MSGVLGKYRLDQRLGGGGMAEVFLASTLGAEGFSRRVAIKRVLPGFSDNPTFAKMFVDEAQISSRLVHPNIVSVLDFDRGSDGGLFLVMELVDGKDLDALVSTGMLPIPVVIFAISEALRGLGYAHDLPIGSDVRGVVHRDVSPHNVLLSWEGAVKVSDFGIAKARSASEATASLFIKGKPAYMSPEQANGQPLDGRSDLFAVGVMLWEMLVGHRLFMGEDTRSTLAAVLFAQIPRPRSIRGDIPKDLERVVMKLLERDLQARYPTAEAAIAELLDCADAPRNGREGLIALLAERFPQEARVRQSLVRARSKGAGTPAPGAATISDGQAGMGRAVGAAPSLSSVMQARTGTIDAPPKRIGRAGKIAGVVFITAASGAAAFAIVAATRGPKSGDQIASGTGTGTDQSAAGTGTGTGTGTDQNAAGTGTGQRSGTGMGTGQSGSGTGTSGSLAGGSGPGPGSAMGGSGSVAAGSGSVAGGSGSVVASGSGSDGVRPGSGSVSAASPDAGPIDPPNDGPIRDPSPVDAGAPDAGKKAANPAQPAQSPSKLGRLEVRAFPVLTVSLDGKRIGDTPIDKKVPVGKHTLRLFNTDRKYDEKVPIVITEDKVTSIERMK